MVNMPPFFFTTDSQVNSEVMTPQTEEARELGHQVA